MTKDSGRAIALDALTAIEKQGAYANRILSSLFALRQPVAQERRLATELVFGSLRHLNYVDFILNRLLSKELSALPPTVRGVLRLSLYQLLFTAHPAYAVVNEAVDLVKQSKYRGLTPLVNAVLRSYLRRQQKADFALPDLVQDPIGHLTIVHSHPRWLVERWVQRWGVAKTHQLLEANNLPALLSIRTNTLLTSREALVAALGQAGLESRPVPTVPEALRIKNGQELTAIPLWTKGHYYIQDEASMLVAHLLAPEAGEVIADLCAAPGGKTTHLAQLMKNSGRIYAVDQYPHKTDLIVENAHRLQIKIIETITADARNWRPPEPLDGILLDAPCTGTGVLRRRPDIRWQRQPADLPELVSLQQALLNHAASLLKPGGRIVYSTCALEFEENEAQIRHFLTVHPDFLVAIPEDFAPYFKGSRSREGLLILPRQEEPDGFFMTRLVKL